MKIYNLQTLKWETIFKKDLKPIKVVIKCSNIYENTAAEVCDFFEKELSRGLKDINNDYNYIDIVIKDEDIYDDEINDTIALVSDLAAEVLIKEKGNKEHRLNVPKNIEQRFTFGRLAMLNMINSELVCSRFIMYITVNGVKVRII